MQEPEESVMEWFLAILLPKYLTVKKTFKKKNTIKLTFQKFISVLFLRTEVKNKRHYKSYVTIFEDFQPTVVKMYWIIWQIFLSI